MDLSDITRLISTLRAQTAQDSITPNGLGSILQRIVDAISSMSGVDVEDEETILQRLSAAESNASTALQAAQNAQAGAAGNVIDSFSYDQDEDEVSLSLKQHGYTAMQVVLPAASSTGAGIMTATDKSHLDTAYGKRVSLMSAPSSESTVTLTITFGDGTTKSVTFVGATAGTGGKAGLMTKEQADQLAALVAAGTAENVRDDAGYLKQQYAAPVILRNVSDETVDDLSVGDIFYDAGKLWQCGTTENVDMGAPSKKVIYYCLADQTLYRWTGSRFVQAVSISSGDITVPTKLSDLINDMGFLTAHQPLKTINGETITGTGNITIDGAAELKDASNHIKQSMATPVVLRNVTDSVPDVLNIGDIYYDSGILWCYNTPSTHNLGAPSKNLVYFCLADNSFYRWTGSSFTQINISAGTDGVTPHIDPTTGNWFIGNTDTGIHAQGPKGDTGNCTITGDGSNIIALLVNNLVTGGAGNILTAEMGKVLKGKIDEVQANIVNLYNQLANIAFPTAADKAAAEPTELDWNIPKVTVTITNSIGSGIAVIKRDGQAVSGSVMVDQGDSLTLTIEGADGYGLTAVSAAIDGGTATPLPGVNGVFTLNVAQVNAAMSIVITGTYSQTVGITYNLTNCSKTAGPTSVVTGGGATIEITANDGYTLDSVTPTVTGATIDSWSVSGRVGTLVISNVTGAVVVSAEANEAGSVEITTTAEKATVTDNGAKQGGTLVLTIKPSSGYGFKAAEDANDVNRGVILVKDGNNNVIVDTVNGIGLDKVTYGAITNGNLTSNKYWPTPTASNTIITISNAPASVTVNVSSALMFKENGYVDFAVEKMVRPWSYHLARHYGELPCGACANVQNEGNMVSTSKISWNNPNLAQVVYMSARTACMISYDNSDAKVEHFNANAGLKVISASANANYLNIVKWRMLFCAGIDSNGKRYLESSYLYHHPSGDTANDGDKNVIFDGADKSSWIFIPDTSSPKVVFDGIPEGIVPKRVEAADNYTQSCKKIDGYYTEWGDPNGSITITITGVTNVTCNDSNVSITESNDTFSIVVSNLATGEVRNVNLNVTV